ncbi:MAG: cob(I)yrinic acid a,c-diamide adenosyltransferase [Actinobacteria bacterium]|nr:cob(I)yrinic acid a,c-diamide adenosyltransferase [Actinomycetota bacterium]
MGEKRGLLQVYTGEGKGKTTAAVGLAVRALGWGQKVYMCQFLKPAKMKSGEMCLAKKFVGQLRWERLTADWPMKPGGPGQTHREKMRLAIKRKWPQIVKAVSEHEYGLVVLDELNCCLSERLIEWEAVEELLQKKHPQVELVITGRGACKKLIEAADLVSKISEIKHPYNGGLVAREGIEY